MAGDLPDVGRFGALFEDFVQAMSAAAQRPDSEIKVRVREHLGVDPAELPATVVELPTTEHPNLQLALDALLPDAELLGYTSRQMAFMGAGFTDLLSGNTMLGGIDTGPPRYNDIEVGDGRVVRCVSSGVYLLQRNGAPIALSVHRGGEHGPFQGEKIKLEGLAAVEGAVSELIRDLRAAMLEHNVYRGRVISLHAHMNHSVSVRFHRLNPVPRESVILPDGVLERLERHAMGIAEQAEALVAGGRHLKRGVLLHGPPGTGKTLSVTYLLAAMPGRTTVLLTGSGLGLIEDAVTIARQLAPATVVFEDVDLVAAERTFHMGQGGALFDLLNQMEGIDDDADLLFLLTTNRPDVIEPALAARPGRVDLALEVPLPDEAARRRLLRLYGGDADLGEEDETRLAAATEGVSGAFIRELMRQAALRCALDGRGETTAADVQSTLDELLEERSALTRRLLGQPVHEGDPQVPPFPGMLHAIESAGLPVPPGLLD